MQDFTSAHYLGDPWLDARAPASSVTQLGKPAALVEPPGARLLAARAGELFQAESATLAPSVLHAGVDLSQLARARGSQLFVDESAYPMLRLPLGATRRYPHFDPGALARALRSGAARPLVVTDGFCSACGRPAPLRRLLDLVTERGGLLIVDDTQAVGLLGHRGHEPFGSGGGGSFQFSGLVAPGQRLPDRVILICSLSKTLATPVSVVAGTRSLIDEWMKGSATRVHASPPALPVIASGLRAISWLRRSGAWRRRRLGRLVERLSRGLAACGLGAQGTRFPVVRLMQGAELDCLRLARQLRRRGLSVLVTAARCRPAAVVASLTARHDEASVDALLDGLLRSLPRIAPQRAGLERSTP